MTYNECSTFLALFSSCLTIEYMNHYQTKISQPTTRKSSSRRICRQNSQSERKEIGRPIIFFLALCIKNAQFKPNVWGVLIFKISVVKLQSKS